MAESRTFTVRPLSKQPRNDLRDSFRVNLSSSSLAALKLRAGDLCDLTLTDGFPRTAIAWAAVENIQNTVVQTSKVLQECYGVKLGDKVSICKTDQQLDEVDIVRLQECTDAEKLEVFGALSETDISHWEWCLEHPLLRCEVLAVNLTFDVEVKGQRRSFRVVELTGANPGTSHTIYRFTNQSKVRIGDGVGTTYRDRTLKVQSLRLGGLSRQIEQVNETLSDFNSGLQRLEMPTFYEHSKGILIYGPKGTGKTSLLRQVEAAGWKKSFTIGTSTISRNAGEGETKLRKIFQEALRSQPSVILIDQVEFIAPKKSSSDSSSLGSVLCETLDGIKGAHILVVAATRHPNDVDDALRTPHRLAIEVELPVPTAADRAEILRAIRGPSSEPSEQMIDIIAEKTHGYVGADLFALLQLACRKARNRHILESESISGGNTESSVPVANEADSGLVPVKISEADVLSALQDIRPTAMKEVFLETPKVRWSDIGGQHDIKRRLQKAVQRPLQFPERMKRLNVNSKKGILLYGPPGCSKTLTVKALATEAGLNFLAVKGAEILSMYVGESERALREIFRKARSARPSIIFFDEIDAIAYKRGSSQGGVNVLTTLLNEMDGIEELRNVLVVAATNKPDVLDPALMRPGRLDNLLYIGPPDLEARQEILAIWSRKSVVHPEVDLADLAQRTEGYSGAEMVSICETAGDAALDEEEETGQEGQIMWKHFEYALGQVRRQITPEVVEEYEHFGSSHDA
ncbi:AAA family ATPase, putative [Paecilomyces variotii No. 5]|uniref:AAA family ATPase, putative n=1 Tax=Byssochlamys spectabilis (strain No. 5 / NBRC 109023) TaxID=1356009 RepID=V5G1Z2_BYSSN|nr:AAA family ATPase, putative [Paecilomyces variotii No. 5]